ncbi:MAG TPA: DUF4333 domain-containing protein [Candidatus Limnocylindria bacterium]|jgi:nitrous oxide reductase accessory protein NosL|nr:DUF4333 domain-containing protein [Candidatus Limnocylindria bacterium]
MLRFAVVGIMTIALAACQFSLTLDTTALEQNIRDEVARQVDGLTLTEVNCPEDRPLQEGDVFTCTATGSDGRQLVITVTQTDSTGNVRWEVTDETFP